MTATGSERAERRYWVMRTDRAAREYILRSLAEGQLRQGWGYDPRLNLNVIAEKLAANGWRTARLDAEERRAWRGNQRMWTGHWGRISPGDIIVLPKLPADRHWTIVEVTGDYLFDLEAAAGDYGHVLPVVIRVPDVANTNRLVTGPLQRTMRSQSRLWSIDAQAPAIERLLEADPSVLSQEDTDIERLEDVLDETVTFMRERLLDRFGGNQFEDPVFRLLERVYDQGRVHKRAGPSEAGADYEINLSDPLGVPSTVVVQLKTHTGTFSDSRTLEQVARAVEAYGAAAAVILTTALEEHAAFTEHREALAADLRVPVTFVGGRELTRLFMAHLADVLEGADRD